MVCSIYYPNNPEGESRLNYKSILIAFLKEYNNQDKVIGEKKFI